MKLIVSCLCLVLCGSACAGDWPTWRGLERDGISQETGLLKTWPDGGPDVVWVSKEAGIGYSSFSVVGDRLFTMGADDSEEYVMALDATSGGKVWQVSVGQRLKNGWGDGPRSTPTYADGLIVAIGGRGGVVCVSAEDGAVQWTADMTAMGGSVPTWGYSESPLVDGDRVLFTPGGEQGTVVCCDLKTGKKIWQSTEMTEKAHYSSIIAVEHFGARQYIQLTMKKVFGLDADGKLLWQADWPGGRTAVIPTPIYRNGNVYITSGYGAGCMLLSIDKDNNVEKAYDNKVMKNHHGGVILVGDHIYGYSDGPGWVCQDLMTGEMVWNEKRKLGKGAVAFADGMFYCLDEKTGTCALISASPDGWEEQGRFVISPQTELRADKGKIWTHPVIADGRLYLRDQEIVVCYQIRK